MSLNWKLIELNWPDYRAGIKERWARINDGHLDAIAGSRERLIGRIRSVYGFSQEQAEMQVSAWTKRMVRKGEFH